MDGWAFLIRGSVGLFGALVFLRVVCNTLRDVRNYLDLLERRKRLAARQRAEIETVKPEKVA